MLTVLQPRSFAQFELNRKGMRYLRAQLDEILTDSRLRIFAAILAFAHLFVVMTWWRSDLHLTLAPGAEAICPPFFENCHQWRIFERQQIKLLLVVYALFALTSAALIANRRTAKIGLGLFALVELARVTVVLQDYRLRLNQHYMAFIIAVTFLLVPHKARVVRVLIVLFYFWAGLLKLNHEWLSGAALYAKPWLVPESAIPSACAYVAFMEIVVAWGLLARNGRIFWASIAQLVLFAIVSVPVVGFFYPAVMVSLLAVFPLTRKAGEASELIALFTSRQPRTVYAVAAMFCALQLVPRIQAGDTAITGEGRWLSLHMFDARVVCNGGALIKTPDGSTQPIELKGRLATRINCEPIVYYNRARAICRELNDLDVQGTDIDVWLDARRFSESEMKPVLRLENFCSNRPSYRALGWNEWILR
jgi:hypothetical protein